MFGYGHACLETETEKYDLSVDHVPNYNAGVLERTKTDSRGGRSSPSYNFSLPMACTMKSLSGTEVNISQAS
jgi:hypothetical protein